MSKPIGMKQLLQEAYPDASPGFIAIMVDAIEVHAKKRHDYNGPAFVQEHTSFHLVGKFWDIKRKYDRLYNRFVKQVEYKVAESDEDTLLDLGNYAFLMLEYIRAEK